MKHIELFESFFGDNGEIIDKYTQSDLDRVKKRGGDYQIFYPRERGGSFFTLATKNDILKMRRMLMDSDFSSSYLVGFGPHYLNSGNRDPKSMVVTFSGNANELKKDQEILYDIIGRNFSLNYPHILG
jgi:hypothetical protein